MTLDDKDLLNSILASLSRIHHVPSDIIPSMDLYMDQVTTFMNKHLAASKRNPDDKILTKTMINNYAKAHLLPSPEKKKYSKEHMIILIFIYYFKNILSINDLEQVLEPIKEHCFGPNANLDLSEIYDEVFSMEQDAIVGIQDDVSEIFAKSEQMFLDAPEEDREMLQHFAMICMLSFDIYVKKMLLEKLIDIKRQD